MSHPLWVRGLKSGITKCEVRVLNVAPFMGAWIEMFCSTLLNFFIAVAPFMGAWIEITAMCTFDKPNSSRTLYGCVD